MDTHELVAELVTLQTISGDPQPQRHAIELCLAVLRRSHSDIQIDADLDGPHPWAVLTNPVEPGARRIAFCCHVDTVPVGPLSAWSFSPFAAEVHDGRLIGRGATDMKGGIVAALAAVDHALHTGVPVALVLTSDEEVGALGAHRSRWAVEGLDIGAAVIPEATGNAVHLGHRGALWLRIVTAGIAAHGSTPHLGRNAIWAVSDLIQRARAELPQSSDHHLGTSTWNVGVVAGGTAPNIVPAQAEFVVDHRTVGNERALLQWWTDQPEADEVLTLIDLPAVWTSGTEAWVADLPGAVSRQPVPYFTDAAALRPALPDVPIVIWGPGDPATMHAADEAVALAEIDTAVDHYRRVIDGWGAVS
jgi:succinyl-diaminopimelate desuccinylase